jgi:hypothetical protein
MIFVFIIARLFFVPKSYKEDFTDRVVAYRHRVAYILAVLMAVAWTLSELGVYTGEDVRYGAVILQIILALFLLFFYCLFKERIRHKYASVSLAAEPRVVRLEKVPSTVRDDLDLSDDRSLKFEAARVTMLEPAAVEVVPDKEVDPPHSAAIELSPEWILAKSLWTEDEHDNVAPTIESQVPIAFSDPSPVVAQSDPGSILFLKKPEEAEEECEEAATAAAESLGFDEPSFMMHPAVDLPTYQDAGATEDEQSTDKLAMERMAVLRMAREQAEELSREAVDLEPLPQYSEDDIFVDHDVPEETLTKEQQEAQTVLRLAQEHALLGVHRKQDEPSASTKVAPAPQVSVVVEPPKDEPKKEEVRPEVVAPTTPMTHSTPEQESLIDDRPRLLSVREVLAREFAQSTIKIKPPVPPRSNSISGRPPAPPRSSSISGRIASNTDQAPQTPEVETPRVRIDSVVRERVTYLDPDNLIFSPARGPRNPFAPQPKKSAYVTLSQQPGEVSKETTL